MAISYVKTTDLHAKIVEYVAGRTSSGTRGVPMVKGQTVTLRATR